MSLTERSGYILLSLLKIPSVIQFSSGILYFQAEKTCDNKNTIQNQYDNCQTAWFYSMQIIFFFFRTFQSLKLQLLIHYASKGKRQVIRQRYYQDVWINKETNVFKRILKSYLDSYPVYFAREICLYMVTNKDVFNP